MTSSITLLSMVGLGLCTPREDKKFVFFVCFSVKLLNDEVCGCGIGIAIKHLDFRKHFDIIGYWIGERLVVMHHAQLWGCPVYSAIS